MMLGAHFRTCHAMLPLLLIGNDGTLGRPIRLNLVSRKWAAVVAGVVLAGIVLFAAIRLVHPMVGPSIAAVSADRHDVFTETGRTSVLIGIAILMGIVLVARRQWGRDR